MAQSTGSKAIPRDKSLDPGEQFDLATDLAGKEEEPPQDKDKLEGARPRDGTWKEVVDDDTDNDEQGSASAGANVAEERMGDSSPSKEAQGATKPKNQEEEERVAREKMEAKKKKKKKEQAAAAKSQGEQLAAEASATTPGTVTPNAKRARKAVQTETREVPTPSEAEAALLTAESSKRPAKRARNRKVSFSNPVALADATTDTPPAKRKAFAPKVITPGAQGSPAEAFSPTAGLEGLRDERDEQGCFIMPPERLLQIIQSVAAELAASQTAEAMRLLTETGVEQEGKRFSFHFISVFPSQSEEVSVGVQA
ncbi:hypothetical protein B0H14DRAFT_2713265 [Mycena olivaceomarginata]|nr:hypothetical protein B0H14DRAFT_2713265 [Mycena olivaceomarginata]